MNTIYAPSYDKWAESNYLNKWGKMKCQYCDGLIQGYVLHTGTNGMMIVGNCDDCPKSPAPRIVRNPATYLTIQSKEQK